MATIKSIEEKAKRYDEVINRMKHYVIDEYGCSRIKVADVFPELKESEDERVRKKVIDVLKLNVRGAESQMQASRGVDRTFEVYACNNVISWLEKQGEQKYTQRDIDDAYLKGVADVKREIEKIDEQTEKMKKEIAEFIFNSKEDIKQRYEWIKCLGFDVKFSNEEKQGEQKPADKVEQKFREGDWVVYCNCDVDLITGIEEDGYCINNGGYIPFVCASDIRLWTIQDAKAGDVLSWDDSKCIAIFKNIYDEDSFNSYGFVGGCTCTFESRMSYHDIEGAHPATKEQRDTLMKAIADAGYAFDFEKKELKKIVQKPAWSEEDERMLENTIGLIEVLDRETRNAYTTKEYIDWLKSLRPQSQWKPSDGQMEALRYVTNFDYGGHKATLVSLYEQLKKLKE